VVRCLVLDVLSSLGAHYEQIYDYPTAQDAIFPLLLWLDPDFIEAHE